MLGVGVVGAGHWGPNLIRNFHETLGARVVRVADRDERRLAPIRDRFPDIRVGTNVDEVLADREVGAVVVATPTATHYAITRAALEAGRHVLVEKPIATSVREAAELGEIAERRGLTLMVGHVFLYNTAVRRVRDTIRAGHLGSLYYIAMTRTNLGPIRRDVNVSWDLASHDVSIVDYWLDATPLSVSASGKSWINAGVEDAVFATLHYPGEILVHLHCSWLHPRKSREVVVVGNQRMLVFDDLHLTEPLRIYDSVVTDERYIDSFASYRMAVREGDIVIPRVAAGEPLRTECEHFIECVATGQRPVSGASVGLAVVRTLEAIERSLKNGGAREPVGR